MKYILGIILFLGVIFFGISTTVSKAQDIPCQERVHPKIVEATYINEVTQIVNKNNQEFPFYYDALNEHLFIVYATVNGPVEHYLNNQDILDLDVELDEIMELAVENLNECTSVSNSTIFKNNDGFYVLSSKKYSLLIGELWNKERFPVKGNIVAYLPTGSSILVTGSEDKEVIEKIKSIDSKIKGYMRDGNEWKVFE